MARQARYFWLLAGATCSAACAGGGAASPLPAATPALSGASGASVKESTRLSTVVVPAASRPRVTASPAPRLFPPLEGPASVAAGEERDGSRRIIAYGLRVLQRPGGALELAREYLPASRRVRSLELPARFGGGFLFYAPSSNTTLFYRAPTFTGELDPFARLEFEADSVVAGFDRLYVVATRPDRFVALDAERGTALGLGSLPPSPAYGKMAFVDGWFGAVQVPLRGTLVTFDAGSSWRPLGVTTNTLDEKDGALRLAGPDGVQDLDHTGTLTRLDQVTLETSRNNAIADRLRARNTGTRALGEAGTRLGQNALKLAVLRGFKDTDGSLVVADAGVLLRIRESDGKLLDTDSHAYPGAGECSALHMGRGFGFACNESGNQTALYAFVAPFAMRPVRTFAGARYVASSGNGSLVIRGSCAGSASAPGAYCIAGKSGGFAEIQVKGDLGVERVVALEDGRVAVIVPPRLGAPGFLSLIDSRGKEQRLALKLPAPGPGTTLLEKGLWLDGFVEQPGGVLAGWVAAAEPFAGVRVSLDGTVTVSRSEVGIDRALLSATRALVVGRTGRAHESIDGGFEWTDVDLPLEFDGAREPQGEARLQGCSELGCAFGGFVRSGWRSGSEAPRLRSAPLPDVTPLLQPGGSRWILRCEASGEPSEPALPVVPGARSLAKADDGVSAPWAPFLEVAAPVLASGEVGFDASNVDPESTPLHAYVWGERGADWARDGHLQLRVFDRFSIQHAALQSAVTRSPWADATTAAESFGFDGTGNPTTWRAVLDAGGRGAAVLVSAHGTLDLLLFEEGKTATRLANAGRLGFGMLSTAAKLNDAWYVAAFNEAHAFTLSKVSAGRVERLAEYPDAGRDIASATLVRGVHGEELGVWVAGASWYLFPIDPATRALQAPLTKTPADLAQMPAPCAPDADGFLLTGSPSLEPSLRFAKGMPELSVHRVEAQFLWSARGLCTRALAAETDASVKRITATPVRPAMANSALALVPLTVSERRPLGRRWGYSCTP